MKKELVKGTNLVFAASLLMFGHAYATPTINGPDMAEKKSKPAVDNFKDVRKKSYKPMDYKIVNRAKEFKQENIRLLTIQSEKLNREVINDDSNQLKTSLEDFNLKIEGSTNLMAENYYSYSQPYFNQSTHSGIIDKTKFYNGRQSDNFFITSSVNKTPSNEAKESRENNFIKEDSTNHSSESATILLFGVGLVSLAGLGRRKLNKNPKEGII